MSIYQDLLLDAGGGVIGKNQLDKQEDCATIAIGLGGTGIACLKNLKRQVYARLQADNPDEAVPEYSHIRFLAVDTDRHSLSADGKNNALDKATEFFDISTRNLNELLSDTNTVATKPEFKWLTIVLEREFLFNVISISIKILFYTV